MTQSTLPCQPNAHNRTNHRHLIASVTPTVRVPLAASGRLNCSPISIPNQLSHAGHLNTFAYRVAVGRRYCSSVCPTWKEIKRGGWCVRRVIENGDVREENFQFEELPHPSTGVH